MIKYWINYNLLLLMSLTVFCPAPLVAQRQSATTVDTAFGRSVPQWMHQYQVPTVGVVVIEQGKVNYERVFGELPGTLAAPANTIFNIASLTKPVTALITLQLVSRGQWSLDEPLARYWIDPDIKSDPNHQKLTARYVLSHQTGFPNWRWQEKTNKLTIGFEPGSRWQYSGEGYEYLRHALEQKFNKTLNQLADSLLFYPLGMQDTRFYWNQNMDETRFASTYNKDGKPYETYRNQSANAANWLLTTVHDYGLFGQWVLNGAGLNKPLYTQMTSPHVAVIPAKQVSWGLGWAIVTGLPNGEYALFHGGGGQGVSTVVLLLPKSGRGLVVFTNSDNGQDIYKHIIRQSLDVGQEILQRFEPK